MTPGHDARAIRSPIVRGVAWMAAAVGAAAASPNTTVTQRVADYTYSRITGILTDQVTDDVTTDDNHLLRRAQLSVERSEYRFSEPAMYS